MTEDTEVTARFLARCAGEAAVSATPQLRLVLHTSLAATQRSSLQQEETCSRCYAGLDLARAEVTLTTSRRTKSSSLRVMCHLCKKMVSEEEIMFEQPAPSQPVNKTVQVDSLEEVKLSKKKKSKKDKTAGLLIPPSIQKANPTLVSKRQSTNTNKLKNLLKSQADGSPKTHLMDFLKQI